MPLRQKNYGNVIFFAGASEGDALAEIARTLMKPFELHAHKVVLLEVHRTDWLKELSGLLAEPVWFAASHFGTGEDLHVTIDGTPQNLWEYHGIPFVRFYGDLPAYFPERHLQRFRNSVNAYSNPEQHEYYRRWFAGRHISLDFPPILIDPTDVDTCDIETKKQGRILFPKNGNCPSKLRSYWKDSLPVSMAGALEAIAEDLVSKEKINREPRIDDCLVTWFTEQSIDPGEDTRLFHFLAAQLDDYLRRVKSTMIAEALLDLPVVIRGRNWDHVDFSGRRATHEAASGMAETLELIDHAPAIIDMSPNTLRRPHDRVWRAVGRRTAFLTNRQRYLDEALGPEADCCSFDFDPESIRSLVEHYVERPAEAVELGFDLARRLRPKFDVADYFRSLVTAIDAASLACGPRPQGTQVFVNFPSRSLKSY